MNDRLLEEIARLIDDGAVPGGVVALWEPGSAHAQLFAHGHVSDPESALVTADTIYDVASITKLFTAALVLRLHVQAKLSVYDRCALYLDNFSSSDLRIIDLLTHQVDFGLRLSEYRRAFPDGESLRTALLRLQPPAKAGIGTTYANAQFFYLGHIVECVSGHPLHDELHALCRALGLRHTYDGTDIARLHITTPPTEVIGNQAIQGVTHDETARLLGGLAGHAGVFTTAEDLAIFGQAWTSGKVADKSVLSDLVFKNYDLSGHVPQALGWWLRVTGLDGRPIPTPGIYSHTGFTGPILLISPKSNKVCAFTCNRTFYDRDNKNHRRIWQLLLTWMQAPLAGQRV